jgi:putative sterol carrier protein
MTTSTTRKTPTAGPAAMFFEELGERGHEPLLRKVSGRVRFDLVDGGHTDSWLVAVDKGELTVARKAGTGDCTIRAQRAVFDEVVQGRMNAIAAVLRGALTCQGDLELLFAIQRTCPGPPRGWDPTARTRSAR